MHLEIKSTFRLTKTPHISIRENDTKMYLKKGFEISRASLKLGHYNKTIALNNDEFLMPDLKCFMSLRLPIIFVPFLNFS